MDEFNENEHGLGEGEYDAEEPQTDLNGDQEEEPEAGAVEETAEEVEEVYEYSGFNDFLTDERIPQGARDRMRVYESDVKIVDNFRNAMSNPEDAKRYMDALNADVNKRFGWESQTDDALADLTDDDRDFAAKINGPLLKRLESLERQLQESQAETKTRDWARTEASKIVSSMKRNRGIEVKNGQVIDALMKRSGAIRAGHMTPEEAVMLEIKPAKPRVKPDTLADPATRMERQKKDYRKMDMKDILKDLG
jgi:polyhydroxyalkanoate synthesis regulator phasin